MPDRFQIINDAYNQPTPGLDAYRQHVQNVPERPRPKWWEIGLGGLVAGSEAYQTGNVGKAVESGNKIRDQRFNTTLQDYARKGEGLASAAALEERSFGRGERRAGALGKVSHDVATEGSRSEEIRLRTEDLARKQEADLARAKTADERNRITEFYNQERIKISRQNAGTASRQAATGERRATATEGEYASRAAYRARMPQSRQNPKNVSQAEWDAMIQLTSETPEYRRFLTKGTDSSGNESVTGYALAPNAGPEEKAAFQNFLIEVRKRAKKRLMGGVQDDLMVELPEDDEEEE